MQIRPFATRCLLVVGLAVSTLASAGEPLRLDASSDTAAEESFKRMADRLGAKQQQKLQIAILQINMIGVNSAYETMANPELRKVSVARIKDKIAGMTADEIIDFANRNSTVKIEVQAR